MNYFFNKNETVSLQDQLKSEAMVQALYEASVIGCVKVVQLFTF